MLGTCLQNVREKGPLVHNITNYVTVNDVANVILACGASPIMSDEPQDVQDITAICGGLNINISTDYIKLYFLHQVDSCIRSKRTCSCTNRIKQNHMI